MNTIFKKIVLIVLSIMIPLTAIVLLLVFDYVHSSYIETITNDLNRTNLLIKKMLRESIYYEKIDTIQIEIEKLSNITKTRITIIGLDGDVWADSDEDPDIMGNHAARIEVAQALSGKTATSTRYSKTVDKKMLYLAKPFYKDNEIFAVVQVALYISRVDEVYSELRNRILLITIILNAIAIIFTFIFSKKLTNPIKDLIETTEKFSKGDFNTKVIIHKNNEFKILAESFNLMTEKIKELFEKQITQQEELKRIIGSMQEGLLVLDSDGKILMHNKSFRKTVGEKNIDGRFYWEILKDFSAQKLINKIKKKKSHKKTEFLLNDKHYLLSGNYIHTRDEVVVVLFDISERKQLEEMKRDFILNASHELRTPLTAMVGFIETMEDDADDTQKRYLEIIHRHTNRLIAIVEDMITVSKLEDDRLDKQISEIDFHELLMGVIMIFDETARKKGIKLKVNIDEDLNNFTGDYFKLEQLFVNLIDNAIKYSNNGKIKINVIDEEDSIILEIVDKGIGIPENDIGRIFERFYTVDKSRARKNVGTGLGLSIVKHIVNQHDGQITVDSKLGKGTKFTIILPKES